MLAHSNYSDSRRHPVPAVTGSGWEADFHCGSLRKTKTTHLAETRVTEDGASSCPVLPAAPGDRCFDYRPPAPGGGTRRRDRTRTRILCGTLSCVCHPCPRPRAQGRVHSTLVRTSSTQSVLPPALRPWLLGNGRKAVTFVLSGSQGGPACPPLWRLSSIGCGCLAQRVGSPARRFPGSKSRSHPPSSRLAGQGQTSPRSVNRRASSVGHVPLTPQSLPVSPPAGSSPLVWAQPASSECEAHAGSM